ncbi:hypothetical protein NLJ89_g6643 [Agrocybe chaxingu]|uniref:Uncharacterized protein n=1 Tax=Agrocybe chaxingu TaxID=84603 RepID=A0A9W8JXW9_9AGAR|nr:hypothetical protein NLJ89_g6643 [Agrocybe chaxingu]
MDGSLARRSSRTTKEVFNELLCEMRGNWKAWGLDAFLLGANDCIACTNTNVSCTTDKSMPTCKECQVDGVICSREVELAASHFPAWAAELVSCLCYESNNAQQAILHEDCERERRLRQAADRKAEDTRMTLEQVQDDFETVSHRLTRAEARIEALGEEISFVQTLYERERDLHKTSLNKRTVETRALSKKVNCQERTLRAIQNKLHDAEPHFAFSRTSLFPDLKAFLRLYQEVSASAIYPRTQAIHTQEHSAINSGHDASQATASSLSQGETRK